MKKISCELLLLVCCLQFLWSCKKEEPVSPVNFKATLASYAGYYSCEGMVIQTDILAGSVDTIYETSSDCGVQFIDSGIIGGKEQFGILIDPLPYGSLPIVYFSAGQDALQFQTISGYDSGQQGLRDTVTVSFAEGNKLTINYSIYSWNENVYELSQVASFTGKKIE